MPELTFEKWIKIANLPTGWGVRGVKLGSGEKEILRIWTVEMASAVAQRHASKGHLGVYWRGQWHPHSSALAWKTPWTEEPGRLQSTGSQRVGHN